MSSPMTDLENAISTERRKGAEARERGDERAARIHASNVYWLESHRDESEAEEGSDGRAT